MDFPSVEMPVCMATHVMSVLYDAVGNVRILPGTFPKHEKRRFRVVEL
jgi:hypothetical protein